MATSGIFPLTAILSLCHTYLNSGSIPYSVFYEKVASVNEIKIRRRHNFIKKSVSHITTQSVMFSYPRFLPFIFLRQCSIRLYLNKFHQQLNTKKPQDYLNSICFISPQECFYAAVAFTNTTNILFTYTSIKP